MKLKNTVIALGVGAATFAGLSLLKVDKPVVIGSTAVVVAGGLMIAGRDEKDLNNSSGILVGKELLEKIDYRDQKPKTPKSDNKEDASVKSFRQHGDSGKADLLRNRVVLLQEEINQNAANRIVAQLLFLEADDPNKDIFLYINSPGGSVYDGMGIYDTIQHVKPDVHTVCVGDAFGMGAFLLCAGQKGKRTSYPNGKIGLTEITFNKGNDLLNEDILFVKNRLDEELSKMTAQNIERIREDSSYWSDYHDHWLSPADAIPYGIIDNILNEEELNQLRSR